MGLRCAPHQGAGHAGFVRNGTLSNQKTTPFDGEAAFRYQWMYFHWMIHVSQDVHFHQLMHVPSRYTLPCDALFPDDDRVTG